MWVKEQSSIVMDIEILEWHFLIGNAEVIGVMVIMFFRCHIDSLIYKEPDLIMLGTLGCPKHYIETVSINTFQSSGSDLPPWLAVTSQGFFVFL